MFLEIAAGYGLLMATVWTEGRAQRLLFWITAAFFLGWAVLAWRARKRPAGASSFRPATVMVALAIFPAASTVAVGAEMGTLHGLFGAKAPLEHASVYLLWAMAQQSMQQLFFFSRFERIVSKGMWASLTAGALFGLIHLPNPVLAPVTFLGGWLLSELYRRYRTVWPLGIAHGLTGLAIAVSVPDHIHHHMRVGLGYLRYLG